jgi:hypothetical protein
MFDTHILNEKGLTEVKLFKEKMAKAVNDVAVFMGNGREAAIFKTKIEEAVFFGTKAIASDVSNYKEIIKY